LSFSVPLNLPCLAGLGEGEYNTPENVKLWESPGKAGGLPLIIKLHQRIPVYSPVNAKIFAKLQSKLIDDLRVFFEKFLVFFFCFKS